MSQNPYHSIPRHELVAAALELGIEHPEQMSQERLGEAVKVASEQASASAAATEEALRSQSSPPKEHVQRGWFGVARHLVANVVEQGLNLPEAARVIRAVGATAERGTPRPPLPTVTLGQIYMAQGHVDKAQTTLEQVLLRQADNPKARALLEQLAYGSGKARSGSARSRGGSPKPGLGKPFTNSVTEVSLAAQESPGTEPTPVPSSGTESTPVPMRSVTEPNPIAEPSPAAEPKPVLPRSVTEPSPAAEPKPVLPRSVTESGSAGALGLPAQASQTESADEGPRHEPLTVGLGSAVDTELNELTGGAAVNPETSDVPIPEPTPSCKVASPVVSQGEKSAARASLPVLEWDGSGGVVVLRRAERTFVCWELSSSLAVAAREGRVRILAKCFHPKPHGVHVETTEVAVRNPNGARAIDVSSTVVIRAALLLTTGGRERAVAVASEYSSGAEAAPQMIWSSRAGAEYQDVAERAVVQLREMAVVLQAVSPSTHSPSELPNTSAEPLTVEPTPHQPALST